MSCVGCVLRACRKSTVAYPVNMVRDRKWQRVCESNSGTGTCVIDLLRVRVCREIR